MVKGTKRGSLVRVLVSLDPEDFQWFAQEADRLRIPLAQLAASAMMEYRQPKLVR